MTISRRVQSLAATAILLATSAFAQAFELCPKYGQCVPGDQFACEEITRSSFITRLCYNAPSQYMVLRLNHIDYHYCGIPSDEVAAFRSAESMGRYYNANIKGGPFDCRVNPVPSIQ